MSQPSNTKKILKWLKVYAVVFVVLTLLSGLLGSLGSDASFGTATMGAAVRLLQITLVILVVVLLVYTPPIWAVRRWWKSYRSRHTFKNDQNEKSLAKFIGNTLAMAGTVTIVYSILLATFAYFIAPDKTTDANNQISELSLKKPGFKSTILKIHFNREQKRNNPFKQLASGRTSNYDEVPINSYWFAGDSLFAERYKGESIKGDTLVWNLVDVVYATSFDHPQVIRQGDQLMFTDFEGKDRTVSVDDLKRTIESRLIVRRKYIFGTDNPGRDYLSRIIVGVRVSISVGIIAVLIALTIGIAMGSTAGYFRGRIDDVIMWIINVFWSIPTLLLVFPIVFAFGQQFWVIYVAVGLTMWVDIARVVRGQVLSEREKEYVEAAKGFGFSNFRIILRHILPNISGPVIVITAANFAYAILIEAGLSFLGIGVQPPKPSWGLMISKHKDYIVTGDPHLALIPGFAIVLLVLSFFLIGNGLRDALDAKTRITH